MSEWAPSSRPRRFAAMVVYGLFVVCAEGVYAPGLGAYGLALPSVVLGQSLCLMCEAKDSSTLVHEVTGPEC